MSATEEESRNIAAFRMILERIINEGAIDLCDDYIHPDMQIRRFGAATLAGLLSAAGRESEVGKTGALDHFKNGLVALRKAFPDYTHTIEHIVAKDDWVAGRWEASMTHEGKFMGFEPTGRTFNVVEAGMLRFEEGRMIEAWLLNDELAFAHGLGADIRFGASE